MTRRLRTAAMMATVIAAGLLSRRHPLPGVLGKETGDALWATAAFLAVRLARPEWPTRKVAAVALAAAVAIEFSQLYHTPMLDRFRAHGIGHVLLGSRFSWSDQSAYVVGVLIAWPADAALIRRSHHQHR